MSDDALEVNSNVAIPRGELLFRATRAGGPGGQHVNTSSTRVELRWNVITTTALDEPARARAAKRLASRLDAEGYIRVVASESRSQLRNREAAERRLATLVRAALVVPKVRRKTKPSRAAKARRLDAKRQNADKKRRRRVQGDDD